MAHAINLTLIDFFFDQNPTNLLAPQGALGGVMF